MFTYKRVFEKKTFLGCIEEIKKKVDISLYDYIDKLDSAGMRFRPLLLCVAPFDIHDDKVTFSFLDHDAISIFYIDINIFCGMYKFSFTIEDILVMESLYSDGYCVTTDDFRNCEENVDYREDHGQSKILISTLIPLIGAEKEVHLLVIGSSCEDEGNKTNFRAGRSYEVLLDFLPRLGYIGSLTMYDPFEYDRVFFKDGFYCKFVRGKYNYSDKVLSPNGKEITHVYDDVWAITRTDIKHKNVEFDEVSTELSDAENTKFSYKIDVLSSGKRLLIFRSGLKNHIDLPGAIGGGYIIRRLTHLGKRSYFVYGSSNRVGHYSKKIVRRVLSGADVQFEEKVGIGRLRWDPDSLLMKNYSNAVISCKNFGEDVGVTGKLYEQIWYTGYEKRLVIGEKRSGKTSYWQGCGCKCCEQYGLVVNGIKNYKGTGINVVINALNSVIDDKCISRHGASFVRILNYLKSGAHAKRRLKEVRDYVIERYGVTPELFYRALGVAQRFGEVGIIGNEMNVLRKYTIIVEKAGITRYKRYGYSDYYQFMGNRLTHFDVGGNVIDGELEYRPMSGAEDIDDIVRFFCSNFGDLFLCVEGYEHIKCSGFATCGFSADFEYIIDKDVKGRLILGTYRGYYLLT